VHLTLEKKETLADGVLGLTLRRPDGADLPPWEPGAHVDLALADGLSRQYSLCGDPAERSVYQVAVLREDAGRGGSAHVHDVLREGDTVHVDGPRNHFPLVDAPAYLFLAGGIGITPLLPMLARVDAAGADWRLAYGGRTRATMAFLDRLEQRYPDRVRVYPQDETGLLDLPTLLGRVGPQTAIYCCGPEPLLRAVEDLRGGRALHLERFAPKTDADDGPRASFEVELAVTGTSLVVPADRPILDVVEEAGVLVLSSCREGTCGTCETTVLDGVPDHRDSLLTPAEHAANDTMMICVSRSRTARLVLDL